MSLLTTMTTLGRLHATAGPTVPLVAVAAAIKGIEVNYYQSRPRVRSKSPSRHAYYVDEDGFDVPLSCQASRDYEDCCGRSLDFEEERMERGRYGDFKEEQQRLWQRSGTPSHQGL
jgi:hypothetical protein